jgi:ATP-binding cassette, subfamily B, heavy metal transporter
MMAGTIVPSGTPLTPKLKTFQLIWPYLWPEKNWPIRLRFLCAVSALLMAKIATLAIPLFFKHAVEQLTPQPDISLAMPLSFILAYGLARLIAASFNEIRDGMFATVTQHAIRDVGLQVFKHLHTLGLRFHLDRQTGGLSRAIDRGTKGIENLLQFLTFNIIPTAVEIMMVGSLLWWLYDYRFAMITLGTMITYILFTFKISEWRIEFIRTMNETDNEANTKAIDSLLNFETVKYFNNEAHEASRFDQALVRYQRAAIHSKLSLSVLNIGQALIIALGLIAVMLIAATEVQNQALTVGDFVAINTYLLQLYIPLFTLGFAYREVKISLINLENMFSLMDMPQDVKNKANAQPIQFNQGEIVFENVSFHYQPNRPILQDIHFSVPAGHTVALVGSSGAGKSTLSRLLFRFYDVTHGRILIDGQDIRDVTQDSLRQLIGIVPQDTVLFNDTIEYNIAYGRPEATTEEIIQAAKNAQVHKFIESLPEGYQTRVGERGLKLSGGEKQRVAIARTLLKQPKIFLFDEATSALDTRTERQIQASLKKLSAHHTTLVIAHRLSTIVDADHILVLDHGEIIERGTHVDLLHQKGFYATMWRRQQESDFEET